MQGRSCARTCSDGWTGRDNAMAGGKGEKRIIGGRYPLGRGSIEEMTAASDRRDRGCESADSQDAVGGRPLLDPGLISGFEERLFVDHGEDVRSVIPSLTNGSPEARKDWPGHGWSDRRCR